MSAARARGNDGGTGARGKAGGTRWGLWSFACVSQLDLNRVLLRRPDLIGDVASAHRGPARARAPPSTGRCGGARAAGSTQAVGRGGSHNPSPRAVSAAHPPARWAAPRQWEGVRAARGRRREKKNAARPHPRGPAHAAVAATGKRSGPGGATGTTHPLAPRNKVRCRSRPHAPPWTGKHREKRRERYKQPLRDGTETRCPL